MSKWGSVYGAPVHSGCPGRGCATCARMAPVPTRQLCQGSEAYVLGDGGPGDHLGPDDDLPESVLCRWCDREIPVNRRGYKRHVWPVVGRHYVKAR